MSALGGAECGKLAVEGAIPILVKVQRQYVCSDQLFFECPWLLCRGPHDSGVVGHPGAELLFSVSAERQPASVPDPPQANPQVFSEKRAEGQPQR
ncbi:hypothetical protein J7462_26065 [Micromonospora sp. RL09-050-HVF-A]|nr:hypothetical protein [Micromonospora sp. RL09-050-HVF-A]MBW4705148.1 hypothetical protein [Micromonospora sp. RL09-050-HVF-A]